MEKNRIIKAIDRRRNDFIKQRMKIGASVECEDVRLLTDAIEVIKTYMPPEYFTNWVDAIVKFPPKNEKVLLVSKDIMHVGYFNGLFFDLNDKILEEVTHWGFLPDLPQSESEII